MASPAPQATELPRFASVDTFNGPGGQINFLVPSSAIQDKGFDFAQFVPREHVNWLARRAFENLLYLTQGNRRNLRYFNSQQ